MVDELLSAMPRVAPNVRPVVLLVDSDLGLLFWLGRKLDEAGYAAFPARNAADGLSLVAQLNLPVSLAILDAALEGGAHLVEQLRVDPRRPKVILLVEIEDAQSEIPHDAQCLRPDGLQAGLEAEWLRLIEKLLAERAAAH